MDDLLLKNCKIIGKTGELNISIKDGIISNISKIPDKADKIINLNGQIVLPGLIDPHVHFREPGLTKKEDFKTGSESAANGGFTTVIDMPNTNPITNNYARFKKKQKIANKKSIVNIKLNATYNTLEEMEKTIELNPISFKIFMDLESDEKINEIFNNLRLLKEKTNYNGLVTIHGEKKAIVEECTNKLKNKENQKAIDYSYGRPSKAEDESIKQVIKLGKKNGLKIHICHLSSKKSLEYLKIAKKSLDISWEFTPHHLLFNNEAYNEYGTIIKTNPPLREEKNRINIFDIDKTSIIGTDHAPHTLEEKNRGVWNSSPGIPNLETVLPLILTEVNKGNIKLELIPKIFSENPAKRFNLKNKGLIQIGKDADLTVIDLKKEGKFNIDSFKTKAKYSPFEGWKYKGISTMTIVDGKIVSKKN